MRLNRQVPFVSEIISGAKIKRAFVLSSLKPTRKRVLAPLPAQRAPLFWEKGSAEFLTKRNCGAMTDPPCPTGVRDDADLSRRLPPTGTPDRSSSDRN